MFCNKYKSRTLINFYNYYTYKFYTHNSNNIRHNFCNGMNWCTYLFEIKRLNENVKRMNQGWCTVVGISLPVANQYYPSVAYFFFVPIMQCQYCLNIGFTLEVLTVKCQYCINSRFMSEIFGIKCQYYRNIDFFGLTLAKYILLIWV